MDNNVLASAAASLPHRHIADDSNHSYSTSHHPSDTVVVVGAQDQLRADLQTFLQHPSLRAALTDGSLDLQSYSDTVQAELDRLEEQCIGVYRQNGSDIQVLVDDLQIVQTVLLSLHEMIKGFQADLGGLSGDIRSLQAKSRMLDIHLQNRKSAEQSLRHFLQHLVISPSVAQTILEGPINSVFIEAIKELQQLLQNCSDNNNSNNDNDNTKEWSHGLNVLDTESGREIHNALHALKQTALKRCREYLLTQMNLLKRPQTNVRLLQVHGLLKYQILLDFLSANDNMDNELFDVYCHNMSATLSRLFTTYSAQLLQLDATKQACTSTNAVVCIDEATLKAERRAATTPSTMSSSSSNNNHTAPKMDVFCLKTRYTDIMKLPQPIAAHVAMLRVETYPYERLYQSIVAHLVDAVTNEHVFCRQFFLRDGFHPLFGPTLSIVTEQLENYLFTCYDAIGLLLMVSVTHSYKHLARSRNIYSLDAFFDNISHLLWPRLKTVMEGQLRSVETADGIKLGTIDLHPHYVSRRFGEFCCSILQILHNPPKTKTATTVAARKQSLSSANHQQQSAGGKLLQDLSALMDAFVGLLERLAESQHGSQKKRAVFLINNIDHIVCIFQERRVSGQECSKLVEKLIQYRELFVEEELLAGFSKMIAFVQQTELHLQQQKSESSSSVDVNQAVVESLIVDFARNWKENMEQINRNVLSYFSNFRNGMEILKHCLTQLLLYYTRFQDILRKTMKGASSRFAKDLVPTNVILAEIKKYALSL